MSFLKRSSGRAQRAAAGADVYSGLRSQALAATASQAGADEMSDSVFGVVVDFGLGVGRSATMVALADGTASLYTSTGGGTIGAGSHASVAAATRKLIAQADRDRGLFSRPWADSSLADGEVRMVCLAPSGSLAALGRADDLIEETHSLFAMFVSANDLLHQIHVADAAVGRR